MYIFFISHPKFWSLPTSTTAIFFIPSPLPLLRSSYTTIPKPYLVFPSSSTFHTNSLSVPWKLSTAFGSYYIAPNLCHYDSWPPHSLLLAYKKPPILSYCFSWLELLHRMLLSSLKMVLQNKPFLILGFVSQALFSKENEMEPKYV